MRYMKKGNMKYSNEHNNSLPMGHKENTINENPWQKTKNNHLLNWMESHIIQIVKLRKTMKKSSKREISWKRTRHKWKWRTQLLKIEFNISRKARSNRRKNILTWIWVFSNIILKQILLKEK